MGIFSDFFRISCFQPNLKIGAIKYNSEEIIKIIKSFKDEGLSSILIFPELALTGYTCDDLFLNSNLIINCEKAIKEIVDATKTKNSTIVFGAPLSTNSGIYNAAFVVQNGTIVCAIPKVYLPNYSEYYEKRYFDKGNIHDNRIDVNLGDFEFPLISSPVIEIYNHTNKKFLFTVEICEDLWAPIPPSQLAIARGASLVVNISASNGLFTKEEIRKNLIKTYSFKNLVTYAYCSVGHGEASNDMIWDGHCLVYSNGNILKEKKPFTNKKSQNFRVDLDLGLNIRKRYKNKTFYDSMSLIREVFKPFLSEKLVKTKQLSSKSNKADFDIVPIYLNKTNLLQYPYLGSDNLNMSSEMYSYIINSQVQALEKRTKSINSNKIVIGVSGGLDSTHALIVLEHLFRKNEWDKNLVYPIVMPALASSSESQSDAVRLIDSLGFHSITSSINESVELMLKKLGRDDPHSILDTTYENVQAGERTSFLFRYANKVNGIVLGTSDLSELALGWCTYGVGDHMSHYGINVGLPKTVIKACIKYQKEHSNLIKLSEVLNSILNREVSPELLPAKSKKLQSSESSIGKFDIIDYLLYHFLDTQPSLEILEFYCKKTFLDREDKDFTKSEVDKAFNSFKKRFLKFAQFKRTAIPNGPKILINGSLSPRGDWRAPVELELEV